MKDFRDFQEVMHFVAQGVINVESGHNFIEAGSIVHKSMVALCELVNEGKVGEVAPKTYQYDDILRDFTGKEFPVQRHFFVGGGAKKLYAAEERARKAIGASAEALQALVKEERRGELPYWTHAVPQELHTMLDSFERTGAEAAAIAFLISRGYQVVVKDADTEEG